MARNGLGAYGAIVAALLPGDFIHDVAPVHSGKVPAAVRVAVVDEARLRRMRKEQKRAAQARKQGAR